MERHRDLVSASTSCTQRCWRSGLLFHKSGDNVIGWDWVREVFILPTPPAALTVALLTLQMYYFNQRNLSFCWELDEIMKGCDRAPCFFLLLLLLFISLYPLHLPLTHLANGVTCKVLHFNAWLYIMVHRTKPLHTTFTSFPLQWGSLVNNVNKWGK